MYFVLCLFVLWTNVLLAANFTKIAFCMFLCLFIMEKTFLPFNDYLGLSSIFKQSQDHDPQPPAVDCSKTVITKTVCDAWIDKRIEEIIHQYSLKNALPVSQGSNHQSVCNAKGMGIDSFVLNGARTNHNDLLSLTSQNVSNDFPSPTQSSNVNSLTSSPVTPDAASWLTSTTSTSPSACNWPITTTATQQASNAYYPFPLEHSNLQQNFVAGANFNSVEYSGANLIKDGQMSGLPSLNVPLQRRNNMGCSFCRNNKEVDDWVMSHQLKDSLNRVMCPILRSYICPLCFASGDNAHTLGHCPLNPDKKNSSLPLAVRRRTNATGRVKL